MTIPAVANDFRLAAVDLTSQQLTVGVEMIVCSLTRSGTTLFTDSLINQFLVTGPGPLAHPPPSCSSFIVFPRSQLTEFGPQILAQGGMKCKRSQQLGDSVEAPALLYLFKPQDWIHLVQNICCLHRCTAATFLEPLVISQPAKIISLKKESLFSSVTFNDFDA
ncbi:hypothetical protein CEXT_49041 [Caerostris extrusa]|uniref:Sulfotransferase n=1 Tax=Caerostris extrusa TaxID=172846 RepID=A0AAV4UJB2_CAEEX|nr:hypothetical protein CEXT_49041 [Caerostris extrusa]